MDQGLHVVPYNVTATFMDSLNGRQKWYFNLEKCKIATLRKVRSVPTGTFKQYVPVGTY